MIKTAVLISGSGSNLQAIIDKWQLGKTAYDLKLVISNQADAFGLTRAEKAKLPNIVLSHKDFTSREEFDVRLDQILTENKINLVVLAGFMRLLSNWFVKKWAGKILNIHPSLLPAFPGLHTHRKALEYGVKYSGCSVIFVDEGIDSGAIINQAVVPILPGDTEEILAARILKEEHKIFPDAVEKVARGLVKLINGKAVAVN